MYTHIYLCVCVMHRCICIFHTLTGYGSVIRTHFVMRKQCDSFQWYFPACLPMLLCQQNAFRLSFRQETIFRLEVALACPSRTAFHFVHYVFICAVFFVCRHVIPGSVRQVPRILSGEQWPDPESPAGGVQRSQTDPCQEGGLVGWLLKVQTSSVFDVMTMLNPQARGY